MISAMLLPQRQASLLLRKTSRAIKVPANPCEVLSSQAGRLLVNPLVVVVCIVEEVFVAKISGGNKAFLFNTFRSRPLCNTAFRLVSGMVSLLAYLLPMSS
jgi:hypothetical protein